MKPKTTYDITVTGTDIYDKTITIERRVIPGMVIPACLYIKKITFDIIFLYTLAFSTQCSVHLINDGITVKGSMIIVEFSAVGTLGALCIFDGSTNPCK